ncbi:Heavy metal-associated isoprenylated plant protein 26, partial [Ananas comosus]
KKGRGGGGGGGGGGGAENAAASAVAPEVVAAGSPEPKQADGAAATTAVLKVDMHCEGCAKKIRKSIKGFEGVEGVKVDVGSGRLTVVGRMDPRKLRERVETKTKKKVELVSPSNPPKKENNEASSAPNANKPSINSNNRCSPKPDPKSASEKPGDKNTAKDKLPVVGTVVMKIPLHCDGCVHRIRKTILKIKGVEQVLINREKDHVTVKGTMDVKALPEAAKAKLKRPVEVVAPKKDEAAAREKSEKKDERKEEKAAVATAEAIAAMMAEANGMDRCRGCGYTVELVYAPQLFSDENPNACSLM